MVGCKLVNVVYDIEFVGNGIDNVSWSTGDEDDGTVSIKVPGVGKRVSELKEEVVAWEEVLR